MSAVDKTDMCAGKHMDRKTVEQYRHVDKQNVEKDRHMDMTDT